MCNISLKCTCSRIGLSEQSLTSEDDGEINASLGFRYILLEWFVLAGSTAEYDTAWITGWKQTSDSGFGKDRSVGPSVGRTWSLEWTLKVWLLSAEKLLLLLRRGIQLSELGRNSSWNWSELTRPLIFRLCAVFRKLDNLLWGTVTWPVYIY